MRPSTATRHGAEHRALSRRRNEGLKSFCTFEHGYTYGRSGQGYAGACPRELAVGFVAGYERGRELYQLQRRHDEVEKEIARIKAALKDGIPNRRTRAMEVERLEAFTREAEQLEARITAATQ